MKRYKIFAVLTLSVIVLTSFTQCSSSKNTSDLNKNPESIELEDRASFILDTVYIQSWMAGVRGGGSGIHMYITLESNKNNVMLDSVYFRGLQAKVELSKISYIASFKTSANQKDDIIMSNNKNDEYGNLPPEEQNFPFQLKENECVLSYIENNTTKYLLVKNVQEKPQLEYPSAPPRH